MADGDQAFSVADIPRLRARLVLPLSLFVAVVVGGTLGCFWLWRDVGGTWLDALFMTVKTITTIGYGEVTPLDSAARIFTMFIAMVGVGSAFYTFGVVMEHLVAVRLADPTGRRKMEKHIEALSVRQATGASVLAIMRDGNPVVNPPGDMTLAAGVRLLALGTREQLARVERVLAGRG